MSETASFHSEENAPEVGRVIPRWAADVVARLTRDGTAVISRAQLRRLLRELGSSVSVDSAVTGLLRLGWLRSVSLRGSFAFVAPGVDALGDPYVALRAWQAREPRVKLCLAGDSAAWHLGYLERQPDDITIWMPARTRLPKGLRGKISSVKTRFPRKFDVASLGPTAELLRKRRLDLVSWATGLPGFGPEALVVQVASRPVSFKSWVDLAGKLEELARDVDVSRLDEMLGATSDAARQRAAYLLMLGKRDDAAKLLPKRLTPVELGSGGRGKWDRATNVNDHLVVHLLDANAKA